MRIFVGFGFRERDRWVKELVFPLIGAFSAQIESGEEIQGEQITDVVRQRIAYSQALIGFTTRRDRLDNGRWSTHRWVTDELSHALAIKRPVLEVRESEVEPQGGIVGDRQFIPYEEKRRDVCLVEIAKVVGRWMRVLTPVRLQLLPPDDASEIIGIYRQSGFKCQYRLLKQAEQTEPRAASLIPIKGGLFLEIVNVDPDALVQVEAEYHDRHWISSFESVDSIGVMLRRGK